MRKTIFTLIGSALMAASATQFATAGDRHDARRVHGWVQPTLSQTVRDANAFTDAPYYAGSRIAAYASGGGAISAPAGR